VNGPLLFKTSTNPAAFTAATRVVKFSFEAATLTIVSSLFVVSTVPFLSFIGSVLFAKLGAEIILLIKIRVLVF